MDTMDRHDQLAPSIFGKARRAVLAVLYAHPDESLYLRQLARASGVGLGPVQREVKKLTGSGIIIRKVSGRQVYFQANRDCPIFLELQSMMLKTAGAGDLIRSALAPLSGRIDLAFIFGSLARGEPKRSSDIDLMVVGKAGFGEVVSALIKIQEKLNREINPVVYNPEEFRNKIRSGRHFVKRVLESKLIFIIGDQNELGRMAKKRMAG
jgi:predicted nucleotidyltransferase